MIEFSRRFLQIEILQFWHHCFWIFGIVELMMNESCNSHVTPLPLPLRIHLTCHHGQRRAYNSISIFFWFLWSFNFICFLSLDFQGPLHTPSPLSPLIHLRYFGSLLTLLLAISLIIAFILILCIWMSVFNNFFSLWLFSKPAFLLSLAPLTTLFPLFSVPHPSLLFSLLLPSRSSITCTEPNHVFPLRPCQMCKIGSSGFVNKWCCHDSLLIWIMMYHDPFSICLEDIAKIIKTEEQRYWKRKKKAKDKSEANG